MTLRFEDGLVAGCLFGGAIVGSVSLRVSFNGAAAADLVDASVEDDAERWCDMEVAGRG